MSTVLMLVVIGLLISGLWLIRAAQEGQLGRLKKFLPQHGRRRFPVMAVFVTGGLLVLAHILAYMANPDWYVYWFQHRSFWIAHLGGIPAILCVVCERGIFRGFDTGKVLGGVMAVVTLALTIFGAFSAGVNPPGSGQSSGEVAERIYRYDERVVNKKRRIPDYIRVHDEWTVRNEWRQITIPAGVSFLFRSKYSFEMKKDRDSPVYKCGPDESYVDFSGENRVFVRSNGPQPVTVQLLVAPYGKRIPKWMRQMEKYPVPYGPRA